MRIRFQAQETKFPCILALRNDIPTRCGARRWQQTFRGAVGGAMLRFAALATQF
jgi:hypothetical protein